MKCLLSFVALAVVLSVVCAELDDHEKHRINSFIHHLKAAGDTDAAYVEFVFPEGTKDETDYVKEAEEKYFAKPDGLDAEVAICMEEYFKTHNMFTDWMKQQVLSAMEGVDKTKLEDAEKHVHSGNDFAKVYCTFDKVTEGFFKTTCSTAKSYLKENPKGAYCVRKFVLENNLIDIATHHVTLNPEEIDITGVECGTKLEDFESYIWLMKNLKEALSCGKQFECVKEKMFEGKYTKSLMGISAICQHDITAEEEATELKALLDNAHAIKLTMQACH